MEKMIEMPEWHLKEIENTLRIANNIHHSHKKETCFDRCVCEAWEYAKQAINPTKKQTKNMTEIKDLLELLAQYKGTIVSTASLNTYEINQAKASNRLYVDEFGLGYVWLPNFQIRMCPQTEEEVEWFEKWYPLDIDIPFPEGLSEKAFNRLISRVIKEQNP